MGTPPAPNTAIVTSETTLRELSEALARLGLRLRCYPETVGDAWTPPEVSRDRHALLTAVRSAFAQTGAR
jgi:hypothetical protein